MTPKLDTNAPELLPQHAKLIAESAISDAVAAARGYRSVTTKAELSRLGFGDAQQNVPALLIPIFDVRGEIALHQSRPDRPRIVKDRPLKYETPRGAHMVVDVHPFVRGQIGDPTTPLFITEGIRKADAAVSICLCCVGLLGVWCWRGTNEHGGATALSDWESIALRGREVFIVFDSDVMLKVEVHEALSRLKAFLEGWKANVSLVYLPPAVNGSKQGLDDFIATGMSVDDLLRFATRDLRAFEVKQKNPAYPYLVHEGRICVEKNTERGVAFEPLCNFDARILEEITIDDGESTSREFHVTCTLNSGKPLAHAKVPADRFASMAWVTNSWGVDAVVAAGAARRDQLREAILRLSPDARRRYVFAHTGWRKIGDEYFYLTATGAPGRRDLEVELGRELSRFALPVDAGDMRAGMRTSLALLDVAPITVTAPLFAATYRAPLATVYPLDLSVWLEGITGSLKSTLAALVQSHWGSFDRTSLPMAWSSTANLLERRAYVLKDALCVVDDFAPGPHDRRALEDKAMRLLRSQGNLMGRGRLQADLSERRTFYPRGIILSTGEQRPPGHSVLARTFLLELDRKDIDLKRLSEAQANASNLSHALAGYVAWLAPQIDTLRTTLPATFEAARDRAAAIGTHLRQPEALAHLWLGLDCAMAYANEVGAIDAAQADELRARCWEALVERAKVIGRLLEEEKPTRRFAEILAALLVQGRVLVIPKDSRRPDVAREARFVGWFDSETLYLIPEAVYQAVNQFARDSGEPFPVSQTRLRQDLVKEGVADHAANRTSIPVRVGGEVQRVLRLRLSALSSLIDQRFPIPDGPVTGVTAVTGE